MRQEILNRLLASRAEGRRGAAPLKSKQPGDSQLLVLPGFQATQ